MNNKKVAFVCPLYDTRNHFDLAANLMKSKKNLGIEEKIYFVFSTIEHQNKFKARIKQELNEDIDSILVPEALGHYKSQVTLKKFYGIKQIYKDYKYIGVIDSESLFIKKGDFYEVFNEIWKNQSNLNANISYDGFGILRTCFLTLGLYFNKKLRKEFGNYSYNIWFNEIPTYKCDTLDGFFEWLKQFDKEGYLNEWYCFEYYIYAAYLILEEGYHINKHENLESMGGIMEYLPFFKKEEQNNIINELKTHWSSNSEVVNNKTYLLFHLDREDEKGYGYEAWNKKDEMAKVQRKTFFKDNIKHLIGYPIKK